MENRTVTNKIVVHHSASPANTTMEQVDQWHRNQGFSMIGYHYFIEADGEVRTGRPDWAIGAHALSANKDGLGVCLAGNFEEAPPTAIQIISLVGLIAELRRLYGNIPVVRHCDVDATACPGALFPYELVLERLEDNKEVAKEMNIDEALEILKEKGIVSAVEYWKMAAQVVQYLSNFIVAVANYVK